MSAAAPADLVVDACLAIKWYVPEVHGEEARRFMVPEFAVHVPSLFASECANTIWKKVAQRREIGCEDGRAILDDLLAYPKQVHPVEDLALLAYDLAGEAGNAKLTIYDFLYLALAVALDVRLATADRLFHDALKPGRHGGRLWWVADPL